jgi:hypothetical protein
MWKRSCLERIYLKNKMPGKKPLGKKPLGKKLP